MKNGLLSVLFLMLFIFLGITENYFMAICSIILSLLCIYQNEKNNMDNTPVSNN